MIPSLWGSLEVVEGGREDVQALRSVVDGGGGGRRPYRPCAGLLKNISASGTS